MWRHLKLVLLGKKSWQRFNCTPSYNELIDMMCTIDWQIAKMEVAIASASAQKASHSAVLVVRGPDHLRPAEVHSAGVG